MNENLQPNVKSIRFFLYARKSTESDDRQVLSIDSQIEETQKMAAAQGLKIVGVFKEQMSAKATGRPKFNEMMDRIEKGEANGIIAWHPDRLARNASDSGRIIDLLDRDMILDLKFNQYNFEKTPQGKFMLTIMMGQAKYFSDNLGENVKRGNRSKLSLGWLPGLAPLGYLNKLDDHTIIQDPERAPIIRRIFDSVLLGTSPLQIVQVANNEWGLRTRYKKPLATSKIYELLRNPFYAGLIERKGERYQGAHEPIISWEEYLRLQDILSGRSSPHTVSYDFVFRGFIRCSCGRMITPEQKITKGRTYRYYHCTWSRKRGEERCEQPVIEEGELEKQIIRALKAVRLPHPLAVWLKDWLPLQHEYEARTRLKDLEALQKEYATGQIFLDRLLDAYLKNLIVEEEYQRRKKEKEDAMFLVKENIEGFEHRVKRWEESLIEAFDYSMLPPEKTEDPKSPLSKTLLQQIASKLVLHDKNLAIDLKKPYVLLGEINTLVNQNMDSFETMKTRMAITKNPSLLDEFPVWQGRGESNPR